MGKPQSRAEGLALFRFGVIAQAVNPRLSPAERGAIVAERANCAHPDLDGVERTFSRPTLDRWTRAYRARGLEGLMPTPRRDTGAIRRHPELFGEAAGLRRELPSRSAEAIAEMLHLRHRIAVSPRTIRAQLASRGLSRRALLAEPAVFGRYEAERLNQRWIGTSWWGPGASTWFTAAPIAPRAGKQERLNRFLRERFIAEAEAAGIADLAELNERFLAFAEAVVSTRIHAETGEAPIARFLSAGPPTPPGSPRCFAGRLTAWCLPSPPSRFWATATRWMPP